jgi:hypothetical protein
MSAADCMNSQSNKMNFTKINLKNINFIVNDDECGFVAMSTTPQ